MADPPRLLRRHRTIGCGLRGKVPGIRRRPIERLLFGQAKADDPPCRRQAIGAFEMPRHVALIGEACVDRRFGKRAAASQQPAHAIELPHRAETAGAGPNAARNCRASVHRSRPASAPARPSNVASPAVQQAHRAPATAPPSEASLTACTSFDAATSMSATMTAISVARDIVDVVIDIPDRRSKIRQARLSHRAPDRRRTAAALPPSASWISAGSI